MPSTPQVTTYLRQLSKEELLKLAKLKKINIPEKWGKSKVVDTLSTVVSASEVKRFVSAKPKVETKKEMGYKSALKGINLEDRVMKVFTKKGFQCTKNIKMRGVEIDIVGFKNGGTWKEDEYVIVECKDRNVIPADLKKFVGSMNYYISKKGLNKDHVKGYVYTTGVFHRDVKSQVRAFPNMQLKRLKP